MHSYVQAHIALDRVKIALEQLQSARAVVIVIADEQRPAALQLASMLITGRKVAADLELIIKALRRAL